MLPLGIMSAQVRASLKTLEHHEKRQPNWLPRNNWQSGLTPKNFLVCLRWNQPAQPQTDYVSLCNCGYAHFRILLLQNALLLLQNALLLLQNALVTKNTDKLIVRPNDGFCPSYVCHNYIIGDNMCLEDTF